MAFDDLSFCLFGVCVCGGTVHCLPLSPSHCESTEGISSVWVTVTPDRTARVACPCGPGRVASCGSRRLKRGASEARSVIGPGRPSLVTLVRYRVMHALP